MAQYKINKLNDNSPFQIQIKTCTKGLSKQCLTSINSEGTLVLDFIECVEDNDNVFIYENNKIKLARDPSMVMSWDDKNQMVVLFKENVGINMVQNISIGLLENTDYPILYIGNCSQIDASTYVLTILPRGLGFFPLNMDHILPLSLVKYTNCDINKLLKYDVCSVQGTQTQLHGSVQGTQTQLHGSVQDTQKTEGFKQVSVFKNISVCHNYFILLIIILMLGMYYRNNLLQ